MSPSREIPAEAGILAAGYFWPAKTQKYIKVLSWTFN